MKSLANLALRIAVCIAVVWIATMLTGLIGLALSAPIWGVMLAKPLLEFFQRWGA